jgi:phytol kinase
LSVWLNLALVAGSIAAMFGLLAGVSVVGRAVGLPGELQRKCVHVGTGLYALTLPWTFSDRWPAALLICLSLGLLVAIRLRRADGGVGEAVHGVARKSYGELFLALSVGFLFFQSHDRPVLYVLPLLVLTLSDAAAALTGTRYGRAHFKVEEGTKSWEGTTMFFLVTWILGLVLLLLMTDIDRGKVVALSLMIAAFGALIEADSWRGYDNLFVPIGIHLLLANNLDTPPLNLGVLAVSLIVMMAAILAVAPLLKITPHAARAYAALIFLTGAVTALQNVVLPVIAIGCHFAARNLRPGRGRFPDLDLISAVSGAALIWLFLGDTTGVNALTPYNLTFAAAAVGFLALLPRSQAAAAIGGMAAAGVALFLIAPLNPADSQWHGALWPWAVAALGATAFACALRPDLFDRWRSPRIVGVAAVVPLALFLTQLVSKGVAP